VAAVSAAFEVRIEWRVLTRPRQHSFMLSAARGHDERVAGAFAAELLAPAEGIRRSLEALGRQDDAALEAVAWHYGVSPLLVRHQYDNQLARPAETSPG
jgi:Zn-dependent peptidase ImmA (M78 family)